MHTHGKPQEPNASILLISQSVGHSSRAGWLTRRILQSGLLRILPPDNVQWQVALCRRFLVPRPRSCRALVLDALGKTGRRSWEEEMRGEGGRDR